MKKVLVDMLKEAGFVESKLDGVNCQHSVLTLRAERDVEVLWYGLMRTSLEVEVFVNLGSGICRVDFRKDGRSFKSRWYDTVGKRTYNAIAETVKNAGFSI